METSNLVLITKKIYNSGQYFFILKTLRDILGIKKERNLYRIINKLIKAGVLIKVEKNKYLLKDAKIEDFSLANFLYQHSYVSFESALNFYGILSQFPYEITSITTKKSAKKEFQGKIFTYAQTKKNLFFGYQKTENYLIAYPEKALLDQLYFNSKGLKTLNLDEYDLKFIKISRLKEYLKKYPRNKQFKKAVELFRAKREKRFLSEAKGSYFERSEKKGSAEQSEAGSY